MPVHGNWPVVRRALDALRDHARGVEVVVVDDGSPPDAREGLAGEPAIRLLRNERADGFVNACNRGAAEADGDLVCFLNSDAIVGPGWLEPLVRAVDDSGTAAAVPVLLNEDGTVQEAGGAVGRDGATYPLGRGASASDPAWSFRREVDYGSAACLLVRRNEFERVGGFDVSFAPAYYEDADLCLRLSRERLRTVVEPASRVVHIGYGSSTIDAARAQVRRNRVVFMRRWGSRLEHRPVVVAAAAWPHRALALRDAIPLVRFLVFGDAAVAEELRASWDPVRVTLAGAPAPEGVEQAPDDELDEWLEARRFHYSAVVGAGADLHRALARSQPQAVRLDAADAASLAAAGIAGTDGAPRG